jgi:aryl-alcohol dehydrogenase-like predicted oxidoreductase
MLGFGGGMSWWQAYETEERALEALTLAVDLGITYIDTGQGYGKGLSELWIGRLLRERRDEVFIATKISVRDGEEALKETERCLNRLQTDRIDLLHIHNLRGEDDLAVIETKGGPLDVLYKLRGEKVARFIGITSHTDASVLKTAIERHDLDCTQMPLNAALQGYANDTPSSDGPSFESLALPAAKNKDMGVIAMKVTARNALIGEEPRKANPPDLLRYSLSLPVSLAVIGMSTLDHIRENAALAASFEPMPRQTMRELSTKLAGANKAALDGHFLHHQDA